MAKKDTINAQGTEIILLSHRKDDYIKKGIEVWM